MISEAPLAVPDLGIKRLLYVVTGSVQAASTPAWLMWLRSSYPELQVRVTVTHSALRFVTLEALSTVGQCPVHVDAWTDDQADALHLELAQWPDGVLVHPATFDFVGRYAHGLGNSPVLLALQCTQAPVVVCPSVPPGGESNAAFHANVATLCTRDNLAVMPCVPGLSMALNTISNGGATMLPHAIKALEELRLCQQDDE